MTSLPIDVVILTLNEEKNLPACLESVKRFAKKIFVVDSGSTDATAQIARDQGADVVVHEFSSHAAQWAWALGALPFESPWVLAIDADQQVSEELAASLERFVAGSDSYDGAFVPRRQVFRGRWIRHGGYYPKYLLKLFRRSAVRLDERDRVDHHFYVDGRTALLSGDLIEANRNEDVIATWIAKHNRYARLQALEELEAANHRPRRFFGTPDERTESLKARWRTMPLYVRPFLYFVYRYGFRLGFLDGKEGFIFHFLQAFWYRLLVDINIDEIRRDRAAVTDRAGTL